MSRLAAKLSRISIVQKMRRRGFVILLSALIGIGALIGCNHSKTGGISDSGNRTRHFAVPAAGGAVDTSQPDHVVGSGTPASCTSSAVVQAVAEGGIITFNCGRAPDTIVMSATANVAKTEHQVVLDGGGLVTLSGAGQRRILFSDTCDGTRSTGDCINQPYPNVVVQNIAFEYGYSGSHQAFPCRVSGPQCWYGGVDGGGAIYAQGGQFKAVNSQFTDNQCYTYGPDLGGGAIRVLAQYKNHPVYIASDTFTGNRCSNGGALSSINVQWDITNSVFTGNQASGWGANPAKAGTPGGGNGGAIYNDGENYNTIIAGTTMTNNTAREGGGAIFYVVNSGWGTLSLEDTHLHGNISGQFQNYPGVYDNVDLRDHPLAMINSTDS